MGAWGEWPGPIDVSTDTRTSLENVTAGTATASKAVVLNSSKGISTITSATITTLTSTTVRSTTLTSAAGPLDVDTVLKPTAASGADAANALLLGVGTTGDPATTATASKNFGEFRCQSTATSGDNRLLYMRYELAGTGGGECLRAFTKIQATVGTARGAHISLDIDATVGDKVTGLAAGVDAQLLLANKVGEAGIGAHCALNVEIYSAGASTDYATANKLSYIRLVNGGNATGVGNVDDDAYLLDLVGVTEGAGNMIVASTTEANYVSAARCRINGVEKWLMFASASG